MNKPRRDITLGEMQDECSFRGDNCETIGGDKCKFFELCATMQTIDKGCLTPIMWNLTDPPRFNEEQMALLKAFKGVGAERVRITVYGQGQRTFDLIDRFGNAMAFTAILGISGYETLDLAELLGKDAT